MMMAGEEVLRVQPFQLQKVLDVMDIAMFTLTLLCYEYKCHMFSDALPAKIAIPIRAKLSTLPLYM